jgi:predicted Zn finger-like uncharacterized protein
MIVICTKCQAKFRVADDRVGPRGAKVRCSRCETVFLVQREAAARAPPPAPAEDPFAPAAPRSTLVTDLSDLLGPAPAPAKPRAVPPPLPFAAARAATPAAEPAPAPELGPAAALDSGDPLPAPDPDPFAAPAAAPEPDPFAPAPSTAAAPAVAPPVDDGGLALEDRFTPPPVKVAPPPAAPLEIAETSSLDLAGSPGAAGDARSASVLSKFSALASGGLDPNVVDPFPGAADPFDPGPLERAPLPGDAPAAAADAPPGEAQPQAPAPRAERPAPAGDDAAPAAAVARAKRMAGHRSRVRAIAMNAAALAALLAVAVALLAVAVALLAVWRADGTTLRPAGLLAALRGGGAAAHPYVAEDVRSGLYDRLRGAPLLFVRGKVVSRAPAPVPGLVVSVEVVRAGAVIARGEAVAGGIATPEELHAAVDGAALGRAASAARARAPREVRPGEALPFLVAVGDAPADLEGAALRVDVAPVGRPR